MIRNSVRKLALVTVAATTLVVVFAGAALAAPPAMTLSSFEPTSTDGIINGGTRTISVTNFDAETLSGHTVDLGEAPCDCVVSGITGGIGTIEGGTWLVGDLAPGATAEVTFTYGSAASTAATPLPFSTTPILATLAVLLSLAALAATDVRWPLSQLPATV